MDNDPNGEHPEHEETLGKLVCSYMDRLIDGERIAPEEILRDHPTLGPSILDELETFTEIGVAPEGSHAAPLGTLGDYTLRRQIGRGGMGVVYEAWQNSMDRRVALKVLPPGVAADNKALYRFTREARTAGQLNHQNIVGVHSTGVEEGTPWYSMEFVEGETLAQILAKTRHAEPDTETPFGPKDQVDYFAQLARAFADVADGLQHAHSKGVIHRDIKPSNLILDADGKLRILDFGLARLEGQESLTLSGDLMGTVLYMSPEQAMAKRILLDHRTDVYSLGATLYEVLTGVPPFRGKDQHDTLSQIIVRDPRSPRQLNSKVPVDLETIVLKCLRKDAGERYGTAEALAQDLRRFVRGDSIEARPQSGWQRWTGRIKRERKKIAIAAVILVLAGITTWTSYRRHLAERKVERREYAARVDEVFDRVTFGQYSLQALAGKSGGLFFQVFGGFLGRVRRDELKALWARETSPLEEACAELSAVVDREPLPDGHYLLGRAELLRGRQREAESEIDKALECDEDFAPAEALRCELSTSGDRNAALEFLRTKYHARDDWRSAWLEAHWSAGNGQWRRAAQAFGKLIERGRQDSQAPYIGWEAEAHVGSAIAHLELGDYSRAIAHLIAARTLKPGFLQAALLLGKAYYLEGALYRRSETVELVEDTFAELYGNSSPETKDEIAFWVAGLYETLKAPAKGLEWVERLSDRVPVKARLRSYFLYRSGRRKEATEAARKAIVANESDSFAFQILCSALIELFHASSDLDRIRIAPEMLRAAKTARDLDPADPFSRDLLRLARAQRKQAACRYLWGILRKRSRASRGLAHGLYEAVLAALRPHEPTPVHQGFFADVVQVKPGIGSGNLCATTASDELVLFFNHTQRTDPREDTDVYYMTRASRAEPFASPARPVSAINTKHDEWLGGGSLSADGTELYFASNRPDGGHGSSDLWMARFRIPFDPEGGFERVENLGTEVNTNRYETAPHVSRDGHRLYFRRGQRELWMATRSSSGDRFQSPVLVHPGLEGTWLFGASISSDELTLFWGGYFPERPGGHGCGDLWMATRESALDEVGRPVPFGPATNLGPLLNTPDLEVSPHVTPDWPNPGSSLYFSRDGAAGWTIYRATWHPDCNENGVDDIEEIETGRVDDTDGNGVPDECEVRTLNPR